MKNVYVTRGNYAGRVITMDDDTAALAVGDGWAVDRPDAATRSEDYAAFGANPAPNGIESPPDGTDLSNTFYNLPQSCTDFQDAITEGKTSTDNYTPTPPPEPAPAPTLTSIDPNTAALDSADFTLHCYGTNFDAGSVIYFANQTEPTVLVSPTEVTTIVRPSLPWGEVTVDVKVRNADGQETGTQPFTFTAAAAP